MSDLKKVIAQVDAFLTQKMAVARTPALTIALLDRERTLYVGTYGYANLEARTPLTPDHLFEIGSVGKVFTAVALLQLHEQGRLDLGAPVTEYLPWFAVNNPYEQPITIHHLLRNTSGLGAGLDFSPDGRGEVWELRQTTLGFAPGSQHHYSNVGYKVLGLVIEAVTGRPYPDVIQRQILDPLGMAQSAAQITHDTRAQLAVGYLPVHDDRPFHASRPLMPAPWLETNTGDGAIVTNAADMARFWRMLLNEGVGENGRILSPDSYRLLLQWGEDLEAFDDWAYGLYRFAVEGTERIFHTGDMPGYMASLTADLETGLGVVVLLTQPPAYSTPFYPLSLLQAWRQGKHLPHPPADPDPLRVDHASDYAGEYRCGDKRLTVLAEKKRLFLLHEGARIPLEMQEEDVFYTPHPAFDRFMLEFERAEALTALHVHQHDEEDEEPGPVVALFYGGAWWVNGRYAGPTTFDYPAAWDAYAGHYRSHNPWESNFRVAVVKGVLVLLRPTGETEPLTPLADGAFRVGEEEFAPERIGFDAIVAGQALRAHLDGAVYYRFFTE